MPPKAKDRSETEQQALAFCMLRHERLGNRSICAALPPEVIRYIMILNTGYCFVPTPHDVGCLERCIP